MGQPVLYTENDTVVLLIWMVIFGVALFAALIDCKQGNFKDQKINKKRRRFWMSIAGVLAGLTIISTVPLQNAEIQDYVLMRFPFVIFSASVLAIILLLMVRTPAVLQNPVVNSTELRILFAVYFFPFVLIVFSIFLPPQFVAAIVFIMALVLTIIFSGLFPDVWVYVGFVCLVVIYLLAIGWFVALLTGAGV